MHISAIRKFLTDHPEVTANNLTTSQTNKAVVKPESLGTNKPYIDKYTGQTNELGWPCVAPATVFVSHAWKYPFSSTVADVMEQYEETKRNSYFWFDLFTNDQNAVASKDFDWFSNTFKGSIREIGQVLLVLYPWNDPIPIRRAWCLFEISSSIQERNVGLAMHLPRSEVQAMSANVVDDSKCLLQALSDIQAQKAEATSLADRDMIFDVIRQSEGGFGTVNEQVKKGLRNWYMDQLRRLHIDSPDNHELLLAVAKVANDFGFYRRASNLAYDCRKLINDKVAKLPKQWVTSLYDTLGDAHINQDEVTTAEKFYNKSLILSQVVFGDDHPAVAVCYNNMGKVYSRYQDGADKALDYYNKALTITRKTLGEDHIDISACYDSIGCALRSKQQHEEALDLFNKSLQIKLNKQGENHPNVALTYHHMAVTYRLMSQVEKALDHLNKSLAIRLDTLGSNHISVGDTYHQMGLVLEDQIRYEKALEAHEKARGVRQYVHGPRHPDLAESCTRMSHLYYKVGKSDVAKAYRLFAMAAGGERIT